MEELYSIYSDLGDTQNAGKYKKKMEIIRKQIDDETAEIEAAGEDKASGIRESDALDRAADDKESALDKLARIREERAASMDSETAEAMKKREQETGGKRPTKRLK